MADRDLRLEIRKLIDEIVRLQGEYWQREYEGPAPTELGAPATAEQLATLEEMLGRTLPPSYRAFLELHNGWAGFDGDGKILAVEDQGTDWVKEVIGNMDMVFAEDHRKSPFQRGALPLMLGESIRNYAVLDLGNPRASGELDIVTYDLQEEERRFEDFVAFLEHDLGVLRAMVDSGGNPEKAG